MKSIEIDPGIEADPSLLDPIRSGHQLFDAELGRPAWKDFSAEWKLLHDDRGRPLVRLEIADATDRVHAVYQADELDDPRRVKARLVWVVGDLLQIQSHRLLEKLQGATTDPEGN